jgi:hypothetical protein
MAGSVGAAVDAVVGFASVTPVCADFCGPATGSFEAGTESPEGFCDISAASDAMSDSPRITSPLDNAPDDLKFCLAGAPQALAANVNNSARISTHVMHFRDLFPLQGRSRFRAICLIRLLQLILTLCATTVNKTDSQM